MLDDDTTDPTRKLFRHIKGAIVEYDRAMIVARLRWGRESKARKGGRAVGRAPYGYQSHDGRLIPDIETAQVVKEIFIAIKNKKSAHSIAKGLNDRQIKTGLGKPWTARAIMLIVRNPIYMGRVIVDGQLRAGQHQPLISARIFNKVQSVIN